MPITALMDRTTVNIAKSQKNFIDIIILPAYSALAEVIPLIHQHIEQINSNKERWMTLENEYEEILEGEKKKFDAQTGRKLLEP